MFANAVKTGGWLAALDDFRSWLIQAALTASGGKGGISSHIHGSSRSSSAGDSESARQTGQAHTMSPAALDVPAMRAYVSRLLALTS